MTPRSASDRPIRGGDLLRAACGKTLRKWRVARGNLGQAALSRKAGLPFHAVGSLERGARAVDLREIARLCGALDMAVPVFLQDLHRSLLEALQPLLQNLRDGTHDGDELSRAAD